MAVRVRVLKRWGCYCPGDILEPAGVLRDQLVSLGLVELVAEPAPSETADPDREMEQDTAETAALDLEPETALVETPAPPVETAADKSARNRKR